MAQAMAVLPPAVVLERLDDGDSFPASTGRDLTGLSPRQDPPPPRV
jgi:hypothetical protein